MAPMARNSPTLLAANSTFSAFMLLRYSSVNFGTTASAAEGAMPSPPSDVEVNLRNGHDVVHVERPAQHHLDRQAEHGQPEEDHDVEARRPHLLVEMPQPLLREQGRQAEEERRHQEEPEA